MHHTEVAPIYAELLSIVDYCEQAESVSEVHGVLCGLLCRDPFVGASQWVPILEFEGEPSDQHFEMSRNQLEQLLSHSIKMLNQVDSQFEPMLPDDDEPLNVRINELARWSQGFLYGFSAYKPSKDEVAAFDYEHYDEDEELDTIREKAMQVAEVELQSELEAELQALKQEQSADDEEEFPETVEEVLRDLTELSRAGHQDDTKDESAEAAFMELQEFLSVSVQLVFEEMAGTMLQGRQEKIEVNPLYEYDADNEIVH